MSVESRPFCHVFDIDDTLYLERDYVRSGFEAVGRYVNHKWNISGFAEAAWRLFEGGSRGRTFDIVLDHLGRTSSSAEITALISVYRKHFPTITLLPDARVALEQAAGGPVAFITDGPLESQRTKAQALGLNELGALIIYTAELGANAGKPSPKAFQRVQDHYGSSFRYVYYADNPSKDFKAPRALGWNTVRIRRQGGLHEKHGSGPDVDVEQVENLKLWSL